MQTPLKNKLFTAKQFILRQKRRCKVFSSRLSRREGRIERLEARIKQLEQRIEPGRVANYHYPLQIILIAVFMVVHAQGSLRCAAKTVGFVSKLLGWDVSRSVAKNSSLCLAFHYLPIAAIAKP